MIYTNYVSEYLYKKEQFKITIHLSFLQTIQYIFLKNLWHFSSNVLNYIFISGEKFKFERDYFCSIQLQRYFDHFFFSFLKKNYEKEKGILWYVDWNGVSQRFDNLCNFTHEILKNRSRGASDTFGGRKM